MNEFDKSKVIIIGDGIDYIGDIDDDSLHVMNIKKYGIEVYGSDSEFSKLDNSSSPNLGVLELIKRGKVVFLNLSRFGYKYALIYFPFSISEIDSKLIDEVFGQMVGYEVLADFCEKDADSNLLGDMVRDSYDEGFYDIYEYLKQNQKNKGL